MGILQMLAQATGADPFNGWRPIPPGWSDTLPTVAGSPYHVPPTASEAPQPQPQPSAPAPAKRKGVLGALGSVFSPQPSSWLYNALNNPNGVWGATGAQEAYKQKQEANAIATEAERQKLKALKTKGEFQVFGNSVLHTKPDGSYDIITPAQQPSEQERLIEKWKVEQDPRVKALLERAIKGYQYTPEVISAQGRARTATSVAGAKERGRQARITKAVPSATGGRTSGGSKLPSGFIINP